MLQLSTEHREFNDLCARRCLPPKHGDVKVNKRPRFDKKSVSFAAHKSRISRLYVKLVR